MRRWSDQRMERSIGEILRTGVWLASALVLAGTVVHLARHGLERPDFRVFTGVPWRFLGVVSTARSIALGAAGRGLISLGVLVLVATPVVRVAFSAFAFAAQRDRTYVLITLAVLTVLGLGLFGARA